MNNRFKFRCFNRKTKKMYEVDSLNLDSENEWVWVHYYNPVYDKDLKIQIEHLKCILMQCTGLKDKNGTLIYEGDIVKFKNFDNKYYIGTIKYTNEDALFCLSYINENNKQDWDYVSRYRLEVIGNIYENKELLNEQD